MKNKLGFTLAEILIVLTIIGVMAIMTIPSLVQNSNSQQKIAQFKKAFNAISNAYATEFAIKNPPKGGTDMRLLFDALTNQLDIKYYLHKDNLNQKLFEKPIITNSNVEYLKYWIVTEDGIGYRVTQYKSNIDCKSKLIMNEKTATYGENQLNNISCMRVEVDINGPNKGNGITCEDDADLNNLKCETINFYVSSDGFTSGNPDCTISGRILSGIETRPASCGEFEKLS